MIDAEQYLLNVILSAYHLTRHIDSLAPPTQPTSPEKNKLNPRVITE